MRVRAEPEHVPLNRGFYVFGSVGVFECIKRFFERRDRGDDICDHHLGYVHACGTTRA
jgi:hypothetical protein